MSFLLLLILLGSLFAVWSLTNSFILGIYLFILGMLVFMSLCFLNLVWYGLIFMLVYIGGMLVLFFYVLSLNPNPSFFKSSVKSICFHLFSVVFIFFLMTYYFLSFENLDSFLFSFMEENSFNLFNSVEVYLVFFLGFVLVFVLFFISMISSSVKSALRPISFL